MSAYNKITSVAIGGRGRSSSDVAAEMGQLNFDFSFDKRASTSIGSNATEGDTTVGNKTSTSIRSSAAVRGSTVGNEIWTSVSEGVGNSIAVPEEFPTTRNSSGQRKPSRKKSCENNGPLERNSGHETLTVPYSRKRKVSYGRGLNVNAYQAQGPPFRVMGPRERSSVYREVEAGRKTVESGVLDNESDAIAGAMTEHEDASGRSATCFVQRKCPQEKNTEKDAPLRSNIGHETLTVPYSSKRKVSYGRGLNSNAYQARESPFRVMGPRERRPVHTEVKAGRECVESGVSDNESDAIAGAMTEHEDASGRSATCFVQRKCAQEKNTEKDATLRSNIGHETLTVPYSSKRKVSYGRGLNGNAYQAQGPPFRVMEPRERRSVQTEGRGGQ